MVPHETWNRFRQMSGLLQQHNIFLFQLFAQILGPHTGLDFPDVELLQEEHAEARLADSSADCLRQFAGQKAFVKEEPGSILKPRNLQLSLQ